MTHRCKICRREITDPASIARQIGSQCWDKLQIKSVKQKYEQRGLFDDLDNSCEFAERVVKKEHE